MPSVWKILLSASRNYHRHWKIFLPLTLLVIFPLFYFRAKHFSDYSFSAFKLWLWFSIFRPASMTFPLAVPPLSALLKSLPYLAADYLLIPLLCFLPIARLYSSKSPCSIRCFVKNTAAKLPQFLLLQIFLLAVRLVCFFTLFGCYALYQWGMGLENKTPLSLICMLIFAVCLVIAVILPFWIFISAFAGITLLSEEGQTAYSAVKGCVRLLKKHFFMFFWDYLRMNLMFWFLHGVLLFLFACSLSRVYPAKIDLTPFFILYMLFSAFLYPFQVKCMMLLKKYLR